jgi:hypothetical protein
VSAMAVMDVLQLLTGGLWHNKPGGTRKSGMIIIVAICGAYISSEHPKKTRPRLFSHP